MHLGATVDRLVSGRFPADTAQSLPVSSDQLLTKKWE